MNLESAIQNLAHISTTAFSGITDAIKSIIGAARTSDLTGLPNILAFEADFANAQRSQTPHCLLFGDLNGFKNINDTVSHEAGDAALRRAGQLLELVAKNWHGQAYHQSGDEFAILVPCEHKAGLLKELEQYLALVTLPFKGHHLVLSGSFGCADIDDSGEELARARAELACQIAKRHGGTRVVHQWSPADKLDEIERRLRCTECGTAFRCTLTTVQAARATLHCPVCQTEIGSSTASSPKD